MSGKEEKDLNIEKVDENFIYIKFPRNVELEETPTPPNLESWKSNEDYTLEFKALFKELMVFSRYICKCLNEGVEVRDNVAKRADTLAIIIRILINDTAMHPYFKQGILNQISSEIPFVRNYDIRKQAEELILRKMLDEQNKKVDEYVE